MHDLKQLAKQVLDAEIAGLNAVKDSIDSKFVNIIELLKATKGKVVFSGMGKSGHVANKIAATMSSVGMPAVFVHPSEASHGDLGMITKDDVVFLLSNSGETKELIDIINYCKRFAIKMIAIVRRKTSLLVDQADIAIILPEIPEASDVNAPTTSTTMMLAYGDAIAIVLAKSKGFSKDDFSVFHPGGKIGSSFIKAIDIMRCQSEMPVVHMDDDITKIIDEISNKSIGAAAVIGNEGQLEGIITDGDLRRNVANDILNKSAKDIMSKNPKSVSVSSSALEAVNIMQKLKITTIFVLDGKKPQGVVHIHDCFKAGLI
ncbi:MAG: KpsF/GutQ family sugar-phosphate isomerase [Rickettsiales bacterium]|jgi:arabinose-5-phosphate isomerase|nr:KpsF/GutQ family sugar-phosphate isomerase [Rickettsiales bacterium]